MTSFCPDLLLSGVNSGNVAYTTAEWGMHSGSIAGCSRSSLFCLTFNHRVKPPPCVVDRETFKLTYCISANLGQDYSQNWINLTLIELQFLTSSSGWKQNIADIFNHKVLREIVIKTPIFNYKSTTSDAKKLSAAEKKFFYVADVM